jgi:hypothetical protein
LVFGRLVFVDAVCAKEKRESAVYAMRAPESRIRRPRVGASTTLPATRVP